VPLTFRFDWSEPVECPIGTIALCSLR